MKQSVNRLSKGEGKMLYVERKSAALPKVLQILARNWKQKSIEDLQEPDESAKNWSN